MPSKKPWNASSHKLPSGKKATTKASWEKSWEAFAAPLAGALGGRTVLYDPDVHIYIPSLGEVVSFPTKVVGMLVKKLEARW